MKDIEHFVYILECNDGSLYTGYTNNLKKRIETHQQGKGAKYTRGRTPVELVYVEHFHTKTEAMRAEYQIKQLPRSEKLEVIKEKEGNVDVAAIKLSING
ncbi:GIY-YIG nuclease family protein [Alkalihalobacillus sp. AL-G]|uniref:GIY-YIG nuclease family protein n=1 Tax=Alkalihalobacillus sp. AL-G TaxID=2926399 RepID=UPI00272DBBBA|nr:GIY-YIG nuclease family protein [Alkalihalobacillus sp. AL-G]WLD93447.1 GIY-YIG nuclease family protein [Alkalihalobacillus sp. AL-G]